MTPNVIDEIVEAPLNVDPDDSLIALGYDGTLAPIVTYPKPAPPLPAARDVVGVLARRGVQIAVITARAARSVLELSGFADIPDLIVLGRLGAQRCQHGRLFSPPAFGADGRSSRFASPGPTRRRHCVRWRPNPDARRCCSPALRGRVANGLP
jgi:hypothetical protein